MIDDIDLLAFGPSPWGERQLAHMIDRLTAAERKSVALDTKALTVPVLPAYVARDTEWSGAMEFWPQEILSMRFAAREVSALTGVAEDRQRLIASRHFDFREAIKADGRRRRWTWDGIQALTIFEAAMLHLKSAALAERTVNYLHEKQAFIYDASSAKNELLLVIDLSTSAIDLTDPAGLAKFFCWENETLRPSTLFVYSLSSMQRELLAKFGIAEGDSDG